MLDETAIQDKVYYTPLGIFSDLKINSFKNSISLTLFHSVYFIEIVVIVGRQSLPLSHLEDY